MEGSWLLACLSSASSSLTPINFKPQLSVSLQFHSSCLSSAERRSYLINFSKFLGKPNTYSPKAKITALSFRNTVFVEEIDDKVSAKEMLPKIDKTGRFCSPRAARELALSILYASCLEGLDPVRLLEKRMNAPREPGYEFDKEKLLEYNHMSFGGPPINVESVEEANELLQKNEKESAIESEVLAAPPKLVYNKLILRFTRKLLVAVMARWDSHIHVINEVVPANWKNEPAGRILELSILHLAMSEIAVLGTRHQIVINEAVDLAKRFCDGAGPRIINGCLRTYVEGLVEASDNVFS